MEPQTRQLLSALADDLTDRLVSRLAIGSALETDLQAELPGSRQTIGRRLEEMEARDIAVSEIRPPSKRGRPTRSWSLADPEIARFGEIADEFLLGLLERRVARHRQVIESAGGGSGSLIRLPRP